MGFLDEFRQNLPGSPTSVAKTMLEAYKKYIELHPGCSREESMRYAIESKYELIKNLSEEMVKWIIEQSDCLETMVFLTYCCENNLIEKITDNPDPTIIQAAKDITDYFHKEAPEESVYGSVE